MSLIEQLRKKAVKIDLKGASDTDRGEIKKILVASSTKSKTQKLTLSESVQKQVEEAINVSVARN